MAHNLSNRFLLVLKNLTKPNPDAEDNLNLRNILTIDVIDFILGFKFDETYYKSLVDSHMMNERLSGVLRAANKQLDYVYHNSITADILRVKLLQNQQESFINDFIFSILEEIKKFENDNMKFNNPEILPTPSYTTRSSV